MNIKNFEYLKYKWFFTSTNKLVVGGKSAQQNDSLLKLLKTEKPKTDFTILHTESPGSPFSVILSDKKPTKADIKETAIFTASFSRAWRSGSRKAEVHIFKLSQLSKPSGTKSGTWHVRKPIEKMKASIELVLTKQAGHLRAVPISSIPNDKILLKIVPGKVKKESMTLKLYFDLKEEYSQNEILSALPAGGVRVIKTK